MSDRRNSVWTPRRAVAAFAIVLLFAFVASWTSLPARAGSSAATLSLSAPRQPQHLIATRTGTVYPLELPPATASVGRHSRPFRVAHPAAYRQSKAALDSGAMLPEVPSLATLALTTTPTFSTNFAGLAFPDSQCGPNCEPPDTQVAAGPNNIFEVINVAGKIYDKSGNTVLAAFNLNHLFNMNIDLFSSDPRIEYDTISGRWFVSLLILDTTDITTAQNGSFNLAVSKTSNPLDGFNVYSIETMGDFPDQPSLGFNDDKVVTGGNSFSCNPNCNAGPFEGNEFLVWNKSELLAGDATIDTDFFPPGEDNSGFPIIPAKSRSSTSTLWMLSAFGTEPNPPVPPLTRRTGYLVGHRRSRRRIRQQRQRHDCNDHGLHRSAERAAEERNPQYRHCGFASAGCGLSRRPPVGVGQRRVQAVGRHHASAVACNSSRC